MSDTFGDITGENQTAHPVCRVAYTINNTQPVISTIIGDQPLFYMDFDSRYEYEDELDLSFDAADMRILESELNTLKKEMESFEKLSTPAAQSSEEKIFDFTEDAKSATRPAGGEHVDLQDLLQSLRESRLATAYLASAEEHNVAIKFSAQIETGHYDREAGVVFINAHLETADQKLLLVQELRRHWQHRQGALIHPLMFHPDNAVLVNRAQVADLAVSMIRVAWELQLAGDTSCWERIENSSMADLGRAFAREAFLDFRTINNGQASAAVFEAWFLSERCRQQDKLLINQMLSDYKGYVFELEQAEQSITPTLIAALGEMPFGKNYLAEHAITIMEDAIFTDVRDRSNANFLWFIKFERSFRETEQELQTSSTPTAGDVRSPAFNQTGDQDDAINTFNAGQGSAEIVSLFADERDAQENGDKSEKNAKRLAPKRRTKHINGKGDTSNVVYIRAWSGE